MFEVSTTSFHTSPKYFREAQYDFFVDRVLWQVIPHQLQNFLDLIDVLCCTSDHCDWEVRPWSVTATARRSALAGCSSAGAVQAGGDGPLLSGTASPVIPRRSPASAIRQSPSTHRSSRPSQHFRRSCFRHCGPNSLEFSA